MGDLGLRLPAGHEHPAEPGDGGHLLGEPLQFELAGFVDHDQQQLAQPASGDVPGVDLLAEVTQQATQHGREAGELGRRGRQVQGVRPARLAVHEPLEVDIARSVRPDLVREVEGAGVQ